MTLPGFPPAHGGSSTDGHDRRPARAPSPHPGPPDVSAHTPATVGLPQESEGAVTAPRGTTDAGGRASRLLHAAGDFTRRTARRIDDISRADGAEKTGMRTLIWSNCLSMGGDALLTVYLAATLFFAAPGEQQRSNVALYLLVTVAPFAVVAPIIGPLLDRIDRGRRAALAATFGVRAVLCYLLAVHTDSTVLLYICALLCLVFSRAYSVLRAAVVPRVLPEGMPLVSANSRMNVFGMVGAGVLGAIGGGLIKLFNAIEPVEQGTRPGQVADPTLGFTIELIVAAAVLLVGGYVSLRLPAHVDTDAGEGKVSMSAGASPDGDTGRATGGVSISLGTHVVTALRSSAVQKFLGGFLSFFLVFYIQSTMSGFGALAALGALGAAAGVGSLAGTSVGSRFAGHSPDMLVLAASGVAVGCCVLAAVTPGITISIVVALIAAIASALGKIALDAIIQREVPDAFRSSAFSRSETVLQLAWVAGGTLGILLPTSAGTLWVGWSVAAVILTVAFGLIVYGRHKAQQVGPRRAEIRRREPGERRLQLALLRRGRRTSNDGQTSPAAPSTEWLDAPAPYHRPTRELPDFRAAGLRPPAPPRRSDREDRS